MQIAQLTQAGAGLIGLILHLRAYTVGEEAMMLHLASQGLPAAIQTLRQLGRRVSVLPIRNLWLISQRPAGMRSASVLAEFSKACRIPVFLNDTDGSSSGTGTVDVPMLQSLPRKVLPATANPFGYLNDIASFDAWLLAATETGVVNN